MATAWLIPKNRRFRAVFVPRGSLVTTAGPPGRAGATGGGGTPTPGPQGPRGTGWFTGSGAPPVTIAGEIPGDLYLNLINGDVYQFG